MNSCAPDTTPELTGLFAKMFRAYLECSDEIQAVVRDMVDIVNDPNCDQDEKQAAIHTIAEALFPSFHNGTLGASVQEMDRICCEANPDGEQAAAALDAEEASFSDHLRARMEERGLTQAQLAERSGVGQPAISMMLKRQCRPQRRTIEKLASALGVQVVDLWP